MNNYGFTIILLTNNIHTYTYNVTPFCVYNDTQLTTQDVPK